MTEPTSESTAEPTSGGDAIKNAPRPPRWVWVMFYLTPVVAVALGVLAYSRLDDTSTSTRSTVAVALVVAANVLRFVVPRSWAITRYLSIIVAVTMCSLTMVLAASMIEHEFFRRFAFAVSVMVVFTALLRYYRLLDTWLNASDQDE